MQTENMIFGSRDFPGYYQLTLYGVICDVDLDSEKQRRIAEYYVLPSGELGMMGVSRDPVIEVGSVEHIRIRGLYLPRTVSDHADRVTKVEILQAGLGQQQKSEAKGSFIPRFNFAPHFGRG